MKFNLKSLLENKVVLYVMFFLSLTTVFGYFMANNCSAVLFFILLALLTNYFSKNMIVILGCAIVGTHLLAVLNLFGPRREGFKEGSTGEGDDVVKKEEEKELIKDKKELTKEKSEEKVTEEKVTENKIANLKNELDDINVTNNAAFTNMGADNTLDPAEIIPNKDQLLSKGDKAKAKEKAYDILESTIGKDNLKGIASDTQTLLKKQTELMDELKNVTPLLSQAMGMVNNLDLNNLTGMFDKLTEMVPNAADASKTQ